MTQDEIIEMAKEAGLEVDGVFFSDHMYREVLVRFAKLVATKEREDLAQPEQEPVAWQWLDTAHFRKKLPKDAGDGVWNPLYAAPQRTERPVDCQRWNRLEEQAYDLVGKL